MSLISGAKGSLSRPACGPELFNCCLGAKLGCSLSSAMLVVGLELNISWMV